MLLKAHAYARICDFRSKPRQMPLFAPSLSLAKKTGENGKSKTAKKTRPLRTTHQRSGQRGLSPTVPTATDGRGTTVNGDTRGDGHGDEVPFYHPKTIKIVAFCASADSAIMREWALNALQGALAGFSGLSRVFYQRHN